MKRFRVVVNGLAYEVEVEELPVAELTPAQAEEVPARAQPAGEVPPAQPKPQPTVPPLRQEPVAPAPEAARTGRTARQGGAVDVFAPLPGTVLAVKVGPGDRVSEGQVLVILEAMKMENEIMAPHGGVVAEVRVLPGEAVNVGDVMVVLEPA